ncbi:RING finger and CHY zinc finger domain-containing protein 1 [Drosophila ficusphila]|uniref:RING finger and CHY zinc finger domain-containing protein 1 n=1 Tax=Drosophila ficusphila TaxID=30025 RepID=UPI0007E817FD|nr:RING finger and CHY zinc finger domain-containing protein 1 [Drosophila ficusphila]
MKNRQRPRRISLNENHNKYSGSGNIDVQIFTNTKEPNQVNLNSSSKLLTTTVTTTSAEAVAAAVATSPSASPAASAHPAHPAPLPVAQIAQPTTGMTGKCLPPQAKLRKSKSTPSLNFEGSQPMAEEPHCHRVSPFPRDPDPPESLRFGCAHYKRRAMFVTPCCNKFYKCRFCHDENETHHFDRKTLTELICSECNTRQTVREQCENCGVRFGKYTCLICNLFDDADKQQYHCHGCGICRIGGAENFFHCEVCNMCLPIQLKIDGHRCVENISRSHCPVCLGDIHTSRIPCHIPDCGHLLHKMCFDQLLASGHYTCPTCQTSLIDMTALWEYLDDQALRMPVPLKYENQRVHIFCNDCHKTSKTKFHFIGLKCMHCGAYNTTQDVKRRLSLVTDEPSSA